MMRARARYRSGAMNRAIVGGITARALRHMRARAWLEARHERRKLQRIVVTSIVTDRLELLNGLGSASFDDVGSLTINGARVYPRPFRWEDFE